MEIRTREKQSEATCPYCREPLGSGLPYSCGECQTRMHVDCFAENRGCASMGCKRRGVLNPQCRSCGATLSTAGAVVCVTCGADQRPPEELPVLQDISDPPPRAQPVLRARLVSDSGRRPARPSSERRSREPLPLSGRGSVNSRAFAEQVQTLVIGLAVGLILIVVLFVLSRSFG